MRKWKIPQREPFRVYHRWRQVSTLDGAGQRERQSSEYNDRLFWVCDLSFLCLNLNFQVVLCDNLALPFRDESFDAVVSMAVVHHFATAERRARAVRELARVLRIGGRLVISVWAMEQRNRKFESQVMDHFLYPKRQMLSSNYQNNILFLGCVSSLASP